MNDGQMENEKFLQNIFENLANKLMVANYKAINFKYINYGFQFTVIGIENPGVVRIYVNKKNQIKYDFSQIKDSSFKTKLNNLLLKEVVDSDLKDEPILETKKETIPDYKPTIGTDESGKGDYFGPLVAASVYVDKVDKEILESYGVKDSKKISDRQIFIIAALIKKYLVNKYSVIEISPEKYNSLYDKFSNEKKNLNNLLAWAHAKAIEEILNKVECSIVISDKFADDSVILSKLQERGKKVHLIQEHKAERNISVAAASILARERFLEKLKKISIEYKIDFKKGASSLVIQQAKEFTEKFGKDALRKVAKLHFKTTKFI